MLFGLDGSLPCFSIAMTLACFKALGMVLVSLRVLKSCRSQERATGSRNGRQDQSVQSAPCKYHPGRHFFLVTSLNGGFKLLFAEQLWEACSFYLKPMLKLSLTLLCRWLAIQEQLVCNLVRGDVVVLLCHRRITGQVFVVPRLSYCCVPCCCFL